MMPLKGHIVPATRRRDEMCGLKGLDRPLARQNAATTITPENDRAEPSFTPGPAILGRRSFTCSEIKCYPLAPIFSAINTTQPLEVPGRLSLSEHNGVRPPVVVVVDAQFIEDFEDFDDFGVLLPIVGDYEAHFVGSTSVAVDINDVFDRHAVPWPDRQNPIELWNVIELSDIDRVVGLDLVDLNAAGPDDSDPLGHGHGGDASRFLPRVSRFGTRLRSPKRYLITLESKLHLV